MGALVSGASALGCALIHWSKLTSRYFHLPGSGVQEGWEGGPALLLLRVQQEAAHISSAHIQDLATWLQPAAGEAGACSCVPR